ncbi:D-proline reductase (dithiol) protein PrdB [Acetonema longum]|uniref:D-proline reductase, PrdB subunit n=1 Tax=Acetonema longum DSM 6540 TaxID=1009370 RepID=F7NMX6_9FIRM|nr:D-proline reductase (dithiol) protein PrdB [Acetonema longum]EGO62620.1 D-proline reductase, PrdB subunit [Acetonema longum DSM 6540]
MRLTVATGLKSEVHVPVTPPAVWTPLPKPLRQCKVGFFSGCGVHLKSQEPYNTAGDISYRLLPTNVSVKDMMITHGGFDNSDANKDVNAVMPLDRMHELAAEGFIGSVADHFIGYMGGGGNVQKFRDEIGPAIAKLLKEEGVDIAVATGGCGSCHRSTVMVQRAVEAAGISTILIAALPPIAKQQGAPRISAPHVPMGANAGEPNNKEMQMGILRDTLKAMETMTSFGQMVVLPYEYRHNV